MSFKKVYVIAFAIIAIDVVVDIYWAFARVFMGNTIESVLVLIQYIKLSYYRKQQGIISLFYRYFCIENLCAAVYN